MLLDEDVDMGTPLDFSSLYRSSVGFDRLFDLLGSSVRTDWPPYNIEKRSDDQYCITMAIAGFAPDDIELTQHGTVLTVAGRKEAVKPHGGMLHHGLIMRPFRQTFYLADHVKVTDANMENGVLSVDLVREVPEQLRPRRIEIGSSSAPSVARDNQPRLVSHNPEQRQAA